MLVTVQCQEIIRRKRATRKRTASRLPLPVRRAEVAVEPHPVGDALDQPARAAALGVPLVAVHELVREDARDLGREAAGRVDGVDVAEGEVDLFVVVVEVRLLGRSQRERREAGVSVSQ